MSKPELKISIFSDYSCPFCYVATKRLEALHKKYDLKVNWCFIEIHPETPIAGKSFKDLPYTDAEFKNLTSNLNDMASADDLALIKQSVTVNSHNAILFAEASKKLGKETFYKVHNLLYKSLFEDGKNIGQVNELITIAKSLGLDEEFVTNAIDDKEIASHLPIYIKWATKFKVTSVPTFIFGDEVVNGVVETQALLEAADKLYQKSIS